jgi:hybrid cluster-associated redox disulfide protein
MDQAHPHLNLCVQEVLSDWPQTASVFQSFKTACVGCYLARFCSLKEVAGSYDLQFDAFLEKLIEVIQTSNQRSEI